MLMRGRVCWVVWFNKVAAFWLTQYSEHSVGGSVLLVLKIEFEIL